MNAQFLQLSNCVSGSSFGWRQWFPVGPDPRHGRQGLKSIMGRDATVQLVQHGPSGVVLGLLLRVAASHGYHVADDALEREGRAVGSAFSLDHPGGEESHA